MSIVEQLKHLPKIELHAHLTGSVRQTTILELLRNEEPNESDLDKYKITEDKSLKDCFAIFSHLHRLLNDKNNLIRVTREVLNDFANENTVYLELRTTPRQLVNQKTNQVVLSKLDYIKTILNVIKEFEATNDMIVRLILSIDRSKPINDAYETVELCRILKSEDNHIVGIDISGNPEISDLREHQNLFDQIKSSNLKLTVHIAEVKSNMLETEFVFKQIRPDRVGHAVFLTKELRDYLLSNPIPIEICPTSNLITKSVESIEQHPFIDFYQVNKAYPLCICTDDFGMFSTSLTNENFLIANAFKLTANEMFEINKQAVGFIFDQSEETKNKLKAKFDQYKI